jgi:hypothetical protein
MYTTTGNMRNAPESTASILVGVRNHFRRRHGVQARASLLMKRLYWIAGIVIVIGWFATVGSSHKEGRSICVPFSARTGPLGLIGCVDSYDLRQGVCAPMSASDGPLGLIACDLAEEQPEQQ